MGGKLILYTGNYKDGRRWVRLFKEPRQVFDFSEQQGGSYWTVF